MCGMKVTWVRPDRLEENDVSRGGLMKINVMII